jgi:alpha-D-ribose 1-methylphosphonate 5-triphosphate diphosphatase
VDHRILHRLDVRSREALDALRTRLAGLPDQAVVSHEDHTPGQGQYADRTVYERFIVSSRGMSAEAAKAHVDAMIASRDQLLDVRGQAFDYLGEQARAGSVRLFGHDPASAEEIAALAERGGTVAEFPTTLEAAKAARERGMPVVMGAPNALRGTSHTGNTSARELVGRRLVTALASDYLPSGLLAAVFLIATEGLVDLPAAVRLVTAGAAETVGLDDRGALVAGGRADLVLAEAGEPWPLVRAVLRAEAG